MNNYIDGVTIFTAENQNPTQNLSAAQEVSLLIIPPSNCSLTYLILMHSGNTLLPPLFCSHPFNILQTPSSSSPLDGEFMGHLGDRA